VMHIQGMVAIPDAQLRKVSLGDCAESSPVGNGENHTVARIGT
jgi:hypothetical protein